MEPLDEFGFLMHLRQGVPRVEIYKTNWFENKTHMSNKDTLSMSEY